LNDTAGKISYSRSLTDRAGLFSLGLVIRVLLKLRPQVVKKLPHFIRLKSPLKLLPKFLKLITLLCVPRIIVRCVVYRDRAIKNGNLVIKDGDSVLYFGESFSWVSFVVGDGLLGAFGKQKLLVFVVSHIC